MRLWRLKWSDGAKNDLREVAANQSRTAVRIATLLQEIEGDPREIQCLTDDGYENLERGFDVVYLKKTHITRQNLWRLKLLTLDEMPKPIPYRVIYAVDNSDLTVWIMGLMERGENYDSRSPLAQRITRDYTNLGLPMLPRG